MRGVRKGQRLDGIATVEHLKGRCFIEGGCDCWHLRSARGAQMPTDQVHRVWLHGIGLISATRAAWLLAHPGKTIPDRWRAYRICESYDCVNPDHVSIGTPKRFGAAMRKLGKTNSKRKTAAARENGRRRAYLSDELHSWLYESAQTNADAAHGLGITENHAQVLRHRQRKKLAAPRPSVSVFHFAQSMEAQPCA